MYVLINCLALFSHIDLRIEQEIYLLPVFTSRLYLNSTYAIY